MTKVKTMIKSSQSWKNLMKLRKLQNRMKTKMVRIIVIQIKRLKKKMKLVPALLET